MKLLKHINTLLVPATGKINRHPSADYFCGKAGPSHPGSQAEYICIVMLPAHPGRESLGTESSSDFREPVGGHGHPYACTADKYTSFTRTILDQ